MTSGDAGADFSAKTGAGSRMEKSTARIKIQTAARPAQATGEGHKIVERRVTRDEGQNHSRSRPLASDFRPAVARISPRHPPGICRNGWR